MKKYLFVIIITIFFFEGCQHPFISKDQAKNEVNKKGYRVGRWVDYFDKNGVLLKDTSSYFSFMLSEYKDGKPIENFKEFFKNNTIKSNGTFKSDSILYDKATIPTKYIGVREWCESKSFKGIKYFDSDGNLLKEITYFKNEKTNKYDSLKVEFSYFPVKTKEKLSNIERTIHEIAFSRSDARTFEKLIYDDTSWTTNYKKGDEFTKWCIGRITPEFRKHLLPLMKKNKIDSVYFGWLLNFFCNHSYIDMCHYWEVTDLNQKEPVKIKRTDNQKIMKGYYQEWITENGSSSVEYARCASCGNTFNKRQGFVKGVQMSTVQSYSSVMLNNEVAKQMDPQIAKVLMWNFTNGTWFCSRRCVALSGYQILQ